MKKMKNFLVLTMILAFLSSLTVPIFADSNLKTKHVGFVLNTEQESSLEWEKSLIQIAERLNQRVEKIAENLNKKEIRQAGLFKLSYEITTEEKFEHRPRMVYVLIGQEKDISVNIKQEERKTTFVFKDDNISQILGYLENVFLPKDLGLDKYEK